MFRRGKHIWLLLMLLCCANLRSQVVVTLPFFDDFNSYIEDSIRHIDASSLLSFFWRMGELFARLGRFYDM